MLTRKHADQAVKMANDYAGSPEFPNHSPMTTPAPSAEERRPLQCPFCQSDRVECLGHSDEEVSLFFVQCWECDAQGPNADTKQAGILMWNHRPELAAQRTEGQDNA